MGVTEILISWFVKIFFGSIAVGGLLMIFAKGLTYIPALIGLLFKLIAKGISSLIKVILRLLKKENKNQDETQNILEDSEFLFLMVLKKLQMNLNLIRNIENTITQNLLR